MEAAGEKADDAKIKALVASLDGVDIEKAISEAAVPVAAAPAAGTPAGDEKAEDKKKEEAKKDEAEASAGLGALFG